MPKMGYEIRYDDSANRRKAYRAQVKDVMARVDGMYGEYYARDMSSDGIGLDISEQIRIGDPLTLSLYSDGELITSDVPARVAHVGNGKAGLYYDNPEEYQYDAIYSYVQDVQMSDPNYEQYTSYYNV